MWRSGGADGSVVCVLQGICRNIVGEEQRGVAKVACLRKCRYGPRVKLSPSLKEGPKLDTQRRSVWFQFPVNIGYSMYIHGVSVM